MPEVPFPLVRPAEDPLHLSAVVSAPRELPPKAYRLAVTSWPRATAPDAGPVLEEAHRLWEQGTRELYPKLGDARIASDPFTRQQLMLLVLDGDRCAGMVCFRRVKPGSAIDRADSWFKPWPEDALEEVSQQHSRGVVISLLMVHPDYRRAAGPGPGQTERGMPSVAEMVVKGSSLVFLETGAQVGFGMTRIDRGVDKLAQAAGWKSAVRGARHLGYEADLCLLTREAAAAACATYDETLRRLWEERLHHAEPRLYEGTQ